MTAADPGLLAAANTETTTHTQPATGNPEVGDVQPGHGEAVRCAAHYRPTGSWRGTDGNDWQHAAEAAERDSA